MIELCFIMRNDQLSATSYNMHTYVLKSTNAQNKHKQLQCNQIAGDSTVTDTLTQRRIKSGDTERLHFDSISLRHADSEP